jgi:hypothetical protein
MSRPARDFDELVREFYEVWFRFHPECALEAGVSGYEGRFGAVDDDDVGALESWLESLVVGLEELDYAGLDEARRVDLEILFGACQDEHHGLLEQDWRHRDPPRFLPFRVLHQLVLTPQIELRNGLGVCLSRIPDHMRHARSQVSAFPELIPHPWVEAALLEGRQGLEYLASLRDGALVRRLCRNPAEIQGLCDGAIAAVTDFLHFLKEEVEHRAQGAIGCGEPRFLQLLQQRHFVSADTGRLKALVDTLSERCDRALRDLALEHDGDPDPLAWLDRMHSRTPLAGAEMLEFAREHSRRVSAFLDERGVVSVPPRSRLKILESPEGLLPGGCTQDYVAPAPGDPDLVGIVYLNLAGCGTGARLPAGLSGQCIRNGWAGRHLQNLVAATSPGGGSLVRRLNRSASMEVGWPIYAEQMMHDLGFNPDPEAAFARLLEQARCLRLARVEIGIHTGELEPADALASLGAVPGTTPRQAAAALMQASRQPGDAVAGILGWRIVTEARDCLEAGDPDFELGDFHDRVLEPGPIPAPLVVARQFGEPLWVKVKARLGL